jgi:hypothetical protein
VTNQRRSPAAFEAWWALIARVIAFLLGATILVWQMAFEDADRLYLIVAAIGLMGPTVAQSVATVLVALRGGGSDEG